MVDSYDHLAVDWENALRPAERKPNLRPKVSNTTPKRAYRQSRACLRNGT